ncbi:MAG: hypothetical protein ACRDWY_10785 [Actinomycetes bacterium]
MTPLALLEKRRAGVFSVGGSPETSIAADGWFAVAALGAGAVAAVLSATLLRESRLGALVGLSVGGLAGAVVAWRLGVLLGPPPVDQSAADVSVGTRFEGPLDLSAVGVLLAWPTASMIAFFAAVAGIESSRHQPSEPGLAAEDDVSRSDGSEPLSPR